MRKKKGVNVRKGLKNIKKSVFCALKIKYIIKRLENAIVKKMNKLLKQEAVCDAQQNQYIQRGSALAYLIIIQVHQGLAENAQKR